jgi:hypothetical protein
MTIASHELALCVINTGEGYPHRCETARLVSRHGRAVEWARIANAGAYAYEREHGAGGPIFTIEDVLACAAELAEYYERHVKEGE